MHKLNQAVKLQDKATVDDTFKFCRIKYVGKDMHKRNLQDYISDCFVVLGPKLVSMAAIFPTTH